MASKPNIVFISTPFGDVGGIASALKAAGYKGISDGLRQLLPGAAAVVEPSWPPPCRVSTSTPRWCPQEENSPGYMKQELAAPHRHRPAALPHPGGVDRLRRGRRVHRAAPGRRHEPQHQDVRPDVNDGNFVSFTDDHRADRASSTWPAAHFLPADCAAIVKVSGTVYNVVNPYKCYTSYTIKS